MRDVSDVRQFYETRARNGVGCLLRKLRNISKIPAKIDWRSVSPHGCVIFSANNDERRNLDIRQLVTDGLLVDHQRSQGSGKGPPRKITAQTHSGTRFHKNFRLVCRISDKVALHVFSIAVQAQIQFLLVELLK